MSGQVDFGTGPLASAGGSDVFLAKFKSLGTPVWSKRFGDAQSQTGVGVAADASSNILMAGDFSGSLDFGGGLSLTSAGGSDVFVAKFSP